MPEHIVRAQCYLRAVEPNAAVMKLAQMFADGKQPSYYEVARLAGIYA